MKGVNKLTELSVITIESIEPITVSMDDFRYKDEQQFVIVGYITVFQTIFSVNHYSLNSVSL